MKVATRDISDFDVTGISLVNPWDFVLPEPDPGLGGMIWPSAEQCGQRH